MLHFLSVIFDFLTAPVVAPCWLCLTVLVLTCGMAVSGLYWGWTAEHLVAKMIGEYTAQLNGLQLLLKRLIQVGGYKGTVVFPEPYRKEGEP